jgi:hypothetical protein
MVPGKKILARLNDVIQHKYAVTLSPRAIVAAMLVEEVPLEIRELIAERDRFCHSSMREQLALAG